MIIVRKSVSSKWQRKTFLLLLLLSASSTSSCVSCGIFIICIWVSSMNGRDENNDVMNGARKKEDTLSVYYYFISGSSIV